MGDLAPGRGDRLMPTLLDRLTDDQPKLRSEARAARAMTRQSFRHSVLRDLKWLLNTVNAESELDFSQLPRARRSALNYGVLALSGIRPANGDWERIRCAVHDAIKAFEPRILPDSLEVKIVGGETFHEPRNELALEIKGQLWNEPYPLELFLRSYIDLENGQVAIQDSGP